MINAYANVYGHLGYNIHARNFFQALNQQCPVCLVPMEGHHARYPVSPEITALMNRQSMIDLSRPAICLDYANRFHRFTGSYRIGYTVFEYTRLPNDWRNLMPQMDEMWTTSSWGKQILIENGLSENCIGVIPEGVDPSVYYPNRKIENAEVFTFLSIGKWESRKGQAELVRAISELFSDKKDVLWIVLWNNPFIKNFSVEEEIRKLGITRLPPLKILKPLPTSEHIAQLYNLADCFVLPTRGEGWGLPIMEAMACGLPVITTRYSALTDYANDENAYLIDVEELVEVYDPVFFPRTGESGVWAQIDYAHLKELLWHVYTHREEAREKGRKACRDIQARWTWDHAARKAMDRLKSSGVL